MGRLLVILTLLTWALTSVAAAPSLPVDPNDPQAAVRTALQGELEDFTADSWDRRPPDRAWQTGTDGAVGPLVHRHGAGGAQLLRRRSQGPVARTCALGGSTKEAEDGNGRKGDYDKEPDLTSA